MSISFNGTTQYMQTQDNPTALDGLTEFTVMFWCKPARATELGACVFRQQGTGFGDVIWVGITGGAYNVFQTLSVTNGPIVAGTPVPGRWDHVAYTLRTGTPAFGSLYINGSLVGTAQGSGNMVATTRPLTIATNFDNAITPSSLFPGELEDVRIYNRAMGVPEIQTIRASLGKDGIVRGLLCRYAMKGSPGVVPVSEANLQGNQQLSLIRVVASPTYAAGITVPRARGSIRMK